jgi:DNA-binding transcriptional LysR family regulator
VSDPDIETEPLFDEDLIVVAPSDHPLADRRRLRLEDLADHDLLLEPKGTAFRNLLDAQADAAGIVLRDRAEVDGMRLLATLAFEGFGVAVLPASASPRTSPGDSRRIPLDGVVGRSVGLARRRRGLPSAPARALRAVLFDVVAEQAPAQPGIYLPS